jgi:hypothetical protein
MPVSLQSPHAELSSDIHTRQPSPISKIPGLSHAVGDGITAARHAVKRGRYAAEDLLYDAVHTIRHRPLKAVGVSFGIGVAAGAILGWASSRACNK